jgi:hypothetical protein
LTLTCHGPAAGGYDRSLYLAALSGGVTWLATRTESILIGNGLSLPICVWDEWHRADDVNRVGIDRVRRRFGWIERATQMSVSALLLLAAAVDRSIEQLWYAPVIVALCTNPVLFWYISLAARRTDSLWDLVISERQRPEERSARYGNSPLRASTLHERADD